MSNIKQMPEIRRIDYIEAMVRNRYARPSLLEKLRRHVISRRRG